MNKKLINVLLIMGGVIISNLLLATPPPCESECDRYDYYYKVESIDCMNQYRFDLFSYFNWVTPTYSTTEPPFEIISPCEDFVFEFEFKTLDLHMQTINGSPGGPDSTSL